MPKYVSSERYHEVGWMLTHSRDLQEKAIRQKDTSKIIYCCLELRNALEMIDFHLLLASFPQSEHIAIAEMAKVYKGNDKVNNKYKSLKEKTQRFYECVCEVIGIAGKFYDYKKSNQLKFNLSQYLHTYTRTPDEMIFEGYFIKAAIPLINETIDFVNCSLISDGGSLIVQNLDYASLSFSDQELLKAWRADEFDEEDLKQKIKDGLATRH